MTRATLIAGNWKMNLSREAAVALATELASGIVATDDVEVAVFPPFPWLLPVREALRGSGIRVGAQTCHQAVAGAFTGEISAPMLAPICDLILAGHSERRQLCGETDAIVNEKVTAILEAGARVTLCVGEMLVERRAGDAQAVVTRQLNAGLRGIAGAAMTRVVVAYEPVWAIGTGVSATAADAQDMCSAIRSWLHQRFGQRGADVQVLYGGSVTPDNAGEMFALPDVDGALVGGASLKAESFLQIVRMGSVRRTP